MGAVTGEPGTPPAAATDSLATLQVRTADARADAADRAAQAEADEAAGRSIAFDHPAGGEAWRVHVAPSTAVGHLLDEGFDGSPDRRDTEAWVEANRATLAAAAERKIAAGAVTGHDVWVHSRDLG